MTTRIELHGDSNHWSLAFVSRMAIDAACQTQLPMYILMMPGQEGWIIRNFLPVDTLYCAVVCCVEPTGDITHMGSKGNE